jgi:phytol kinase
MKIIIVAAIYGLVFLGLELLALKTKPSPEAARKLAHLIAGVGAACLPLFLSFLEIAVVAVLFLVGMAISMQRRLFSSVHGVERKTHGELYFPVGILLCSLLFPTNLLYMYGVLAIGVSDALASLVGQTYGRKTFRLFGARKTYAGSWAFFIATIIIGALLLVAFTPAPLWAIAAVSLVAASILTLVEAASSRGLDNLFVPLAAAGCFWLAGVSRLLG